MNPFDLNNQYQQMIANQCFQSLQKQFPQNNPHRAINQPTPKPANQPNTTPTYVCKSGRLCAIPTRRLWHELVSILSHDPTNTGCGSGTKKGNIRKKTRRRSWYHERLKGGQVKKNLSYLGVECVQRPNDGK